LPFPEDDVARARLAEAMRHEVERLVRWMGPSFDGWGVPTRV